MEELKMAGMWALLGIFKAIALIAFASTLGFVIWCTLSLVDLACGTNHARGFIELFGRWTRYNQPQRTTKKSTAKVSEESLGEAVEVPRTASKRGPGRPPKTQPTPAPVESNDTEEVHWTN